MAQTTFSGPILAGTIKNTTGTTVGTDIKKTGKLTFYTSGAKHIHGVKEITNGTRYTMGMWFTKDPNHSILK